MLVLSRKVGAKILIADNIVLTVVKIDGDRVSLGIDAPREVPIMRSELIPANQPPTAPDGSDK